MLPAFLWSSIKKQKRDLGRNSATGSSRQRVAACFYRSRRYAKERAPGRDAFAEIWPVSPGSARIVQTFC